MDAKQARLLSDQIGRFIRVEYVRPCPDDWRPEPSKCHSNATDWVVRFPHWTVVHGWLHVSGDQDTGAMFDAHSVVRDENGRLWDVTQAEADQFIAHEGDSTDFMKQIELGAWVRLIHIPGSQY